MSLFAGKSPTERNKIIAAAVLGAMALFALFFAFGGTSLFSSRKTVTTTLSPTPKPSASPNSNGNLEQVKMPDAQEIDAVYAGTPVYYTSTIFGAPDAGRNIFAFYEPPPPTPYVPTPYVPPTPKQTVIIIPSPPPPPPQIISYIQPQMVYAGSRGFLLEVNGDKFTPETHIFFNGSELPTNFISAQKLTAEIPSTLIAGEGGRAIVVRTPDNALYSNDVQFNVQSAPKPTFQYIGMISRRHSNNDTAYFQEQGKQTPSSARLNDLVGGRFRVVSIAANETVIEDSTLGFRYKLPLYRPAPGQTTSGGNPNGFPNNGGVYQQNFPQPQQQYPPGIYPPNMQQQTPQPQVKEDVDDNDDGNN